MIQKTPPLLTLTSTERGKEAPHPLLLLSDSISVVSLEQVILKRCLFFIIEVPVREVHACYGKYSILSPDSFNSANRSI